MPTVKATEGVYYRHHQYNPGDVFEVGNDFEGQSLVESVKADPEPAKETKAPKQESEKKPEPAKETKADGGR